jgi:arginine decarboxylase
MQMTRTPTDTSAESTGWQASDALSLYGIDAWGQGYFGVSDQGHVVVYPAKNPEQSIDIYEVIEGLRDRQIEPPVLLRFAGILEHRIGEIYDAFATAIKEEEYENSYACMYPIKVNQQHHLVEEILDAGEKYGFGLEAGSKPELLAALGMTTSRPKTMIVCNGFKDDEYIETVILAQKLGRQVIPVVEKLSELRMILKHAERHEVRPRLGVRIKLSAPGIGRWKDSGGARSKFGLFVSEALQALEMLKEHDLADCLVLLHTHTGSQICDIRHFKSAVSELAHVYTELYRLGAGLRYIDLGGGLAVDYDGSQTNFESSANYTLAQYASDAVYRIRMVCDQKDIPHPMILSESGRAIVAYSTLMVVEVAGVSGFDSFEIPEVPENLEEIDLPVPIVNLFQTFQQVEHDHGDDLNQLIDFYHDAGQARDEALNLFGLGYLDLELRSIAERLYWRICSSLLNRALKLEEELPEELQTLPVQLSDIYFCNFSVFQSLPDSWAIGQLFPIAPIHRLATEPSRRGVLADITCDSDGKIERFVELQDVKTTLELHPVTNDPYYLGIFLCGAYQETLGDLHNLFGDTNAVHIMLDDDGGWIVDEYVEGDTVAEVLQYVGYEPSRLLVVTRKEAERAVRRGRLSVAQANQFLQLFRAGMYGYTYLEGDGETGITW